MKKKKILLLVILIKVLSANLFAQDYQISFAIIGAQTPDSVLVENQEQNTVLSIAGNDILHLVNILTEIENINSETLLKVYPNPIGEQAIVEFNNISSGAVNIQLNDICGKQIISQTEVLPKGISSFKLSGLNQATYVLSFNTINSNASAIIISQQGKENSPNLKLMSNLDIPQTKFIKEISTLVQMQYNEGETLDFIAYLNNSQSNIVSLIPTSSQEIEFNLLMAPVAEFVASSTNPLKIDEVIFTDQSTNTPIEWYWDFGDGYHSTEQNPTHTFMTTGTYTVSLEASNSYGSSTEIKTNYITSSSLVQYCGTVTDYDGNTYNAVQIGDQCWMAENLKTTKYNDGTEIPNVTDPFEWTDLWGPSYCWYNNDSLLYAETYGALYTWYVVETGNLCPTGWHVPTLVEWYELVDFLGGHNLAAGLLKEDGNEHWTWISPYIYGVDLYGFTALPGGYRFQTGYYDHIRNYGWWWSSTPNEQVGVVDGAYCGRMFCENDILTISYQSMRYAYSVRCMRD